MQISRTDVLSRLAAHSHEPPSGLGDPDDQVCCRKSVGPAEHARASDGVIRGTVDSLVKLISAIQAAGVELIAEGQTSTQGGRGVRLRASASLPRSRGSARLQPPGSSRPGLVASRRRSG